MVGIQFRSTSVLILAMSVLLQIGRISALPTIPTTTDNQAETTESSDCVFSVSPDERTVLKYDLCPLLTRGQYRVSREVETPPSRTKVSCYLILNLGHARILIPHHAG
jgi:hypothetical protein